jgi:internalin A
MKALANSPEDRYQTVGELREDILRYLEGRSVSAKSDSATEAVVKLIKRNRAVCFTGFAAIIVILALAVVGYLENSRARKRAETALLVAEQESEKASSALSALKTENQMRRKEQRQAAPVFLQMANKSVIDGEIAKGYEQVCTAIVLDPKLHPARLLKAQLLIHLENYEEALREINEYLRSMGGDIYAQEFRSLCEKALERGPKAYRPGFYRLFSKMGMFTLIKVDPHKIDRKTIEVYNNRLKAAWPQGGFRLMLEGSSDLVLNASFGRTIDTLEPIRGMPLTCLKIRGTKISDITPVEGMPLIDIDLSRTSVKDLSPLAGAPLTELDISGAPVEDISALKEMNLRVLNAQESRIGDLSPLSGAPLKHVNVLRTNVSDISCLIPDNIEYLNIAFCSKISRFDTIAKMPLKNLHVYGTDFGDADLKRLPASITSISLGATRVTDLEPLRGMKLKYLEVYCCRRKFSLEPLRGMPLESLNAALNKIDDIAPLQGMPLTHLDITGNPVSDLSVLKGMPLRELHISGTKVTDLSPLEGMNLVQLSFTPGKITVGMDILRKMLSLKVIALQGQNRGRVSAEKFWEMHDNGDFTKKAGN